MARSINLEVVERDLKKKPRALRRDGLIPAEIYGPGIEKNKHISISYSAFDRIINKISEATLINLIIKSGEKTEELNTFLKTIQRHRLSDNPIHADFYAPSEGHYMTLHIPVQLIGEAAGLENGGVLQFALHELTVEILPKNVVESVEIDVSELKIGDSITIADIKSKLSEDTYLKHEEDEIIVSVSKPGLSIEDLEAQAEEEDLDAEPEAIEEKGSNEEENE